ncbi:NADH-quinone oxidoreductase subunit NuoH [Fontivita pretiosa]|uniref:NADH-quinone oxidoreductase subunit NuoH n=1 Tax=Fontivita pretiosa TaxID=2989684 RepID=UPI003D186D8C
MSLSILLLAQTQLAPTASPQAGVGRMQGMIFEWLGVNVTPVTTLVYSTVLVAAVFLPAIMLFAMFAIWWERKVAGHMQSRLGPNRVGPIGLLQSLADGIKLITKEDLTPRDADRLLFKLAPYLAFTPVFAAFLALPFGPDMTFEPRLAVGLFWILAILALEIMGVILAGWASNNKWSVYGAMREACQMVSYEIPLGISIIVGVMAAGTLNLVQLGYEQGGGIHTWLIFKNPFAFAAFFTYFIASLASNKRAPFDLPESESELVAGFHTEYSGLRFAMFFFAEYAAMFVVGGIQTALFLGGWNDPFGLVGYYHHQLVQSENGLGLLLVNLIAVGIFVTKAIAIVFVQMWLRWTLPRPRIDQVLYACVKVLLPITCVLLLGAAMWQLFVPEMPGIPWVDYSPWNFGQWARIGATPALVTQAILSLVGIGLLTAIVTWVIYAAISGRRIKQRLTDPAPIEEETPAGAEAAEA